MYVYGFDKAVLIRITVNEDDTIVKNKHIKDNGLLFNKHISNKSLSFPAPYLSLA